MHVQSVPHNLDKPLVALILWETENKSAEAMVEIISVMLYFVAVESLEWVCFLLNTFGGPFLT